MMVMPPIKILHITAIESSAKSSKNGEYDASQYFAKVLGN